MLELYHSINWDSIINICMFVLGSMFIIVATMQLVFEDDK